MMFVHWQEITYQSQGNRFIYEQKLKILILKQNKLLLIRIYLLHALVYMIFQLKEILNQLDMNHLYIYTFRKFDECRMPKK